MDDVAIRFINVSRHFRRGERHDSLRHLVPSMMRKLLRHDAAFAPDKRDFMALDKIDLEVRQGETLGVIGHNGAGESTMLNLFAGIMSPTEGRKLAARWRGYEGPYLDSLAEAALALCGPAFWAYRRRGWASVGYASNPARLIGHVVLTLLDLLLNPKSTITRLARALKARAMSRNVR